MGTRVLKPVRTKLLPKDGAEPTTADDLMLPGHGNTVLSYLLYEPTAPEEFYDLSRDDFLSPTQKTIFDAIADVHGAGTPVNFLSVTDRLRAKRQLKQVGGEHWHIDLPKLSGGESGRGAAKYALDCLRAAGKERQAAKIGEQLQNRQINSRQAIEQLEKLDASGDGEFVEDFDIQDLLEFDPTNDPTNLLGNRWGCEGSSGLWAGGSGYGKSVLATQAAIYWASGGAFFGIAPARALKILIVSAENDRGDTAEMLQGVIRGIAASGDMSKAKLRRIVKENVVIKRVIGVTGKKFLRVLESLMQRYKPDIVFVDPLFAFAGCDLMDAAKVSLFLREGLIPLAVRHKAYVHVVHHVGKPQRDNDAKASWSEADFQYLGFGSSEIQNTFRAVNILLPVAGHEGTYRLILSKRGARAGALDTDGERATSLYLRHSKQGIFWEQVARPDVETRFKRQYKVEEVLEHLSRTEGEKASALQKLASEESGMSKATFYVLWAQLKSEQKIKVNSEELWLRN